MQLFLDTPGENADHALMPGRVEQRNAAAFRVVKLHQQCVGSFAHAGFDHAPFAIECVELLCNIQRPGRVVGDQTLDAKRHIGEAACGV